MNEDDIENLIDCYPSAIVSVETHVDSYDSITLGKVKDVLSKVNIEAVISWEGDSDSILLRVSRDVVLLCLR